MTKTFDLMSTGYVTRRNESRQQVPVMVIKARDAKRKPYLIRKKNLRPWFFSEADGITEHRGIHGEYLLKHVYRHPNQTRKLRSRYNKTWRAKMPFAYNVLADWAVYDGFEIQGNDIVPAEALNVRPRVCYGDIEVSSPPTVYPDARVPKYPMVTSQWMDSYTGEYGVEILEHPDAKKADYDWVHYHDEEHGIYRKMTQLRKHYDWDAFMYHYGWQFDYPYYYNRAKEIGAESRGLSPVNTFFVQYNNFKQAFDEPNIMGCEALDSYIMYGVLTKPEGRKRYGMGLKMIAGYECDFWYTDYGDRIESLWTGDHKTLAEYGRNDVIALQKMDDKRQLTNRFDSIRRVLGVPMQWATQNMKFIHTYLTRISSEIGREIPTWQYVQAPKYKGATVRDGSEVRGYHDNVAVLDLASMYPNIIVSLNLSLETKYYDENEQPRFHRTPEGILPIALKRLMAERERVRALRKGIPAGSAEWWDLYYYDQAFKYGVNSFYGAMKKIDRDIAAATTRNGREMIMRLHEVVRQYGYEVVYWDTDSVFIKMPSSRWEDGLEMETYVQAALDEYSKELGAVFPFRIKYEAFYRRLMIHASKHYVGYAIMEDQEPCDEFIIKGISLRKSDSAFLSNMVGEAFLKTAIKHENIPLAMSTLKHVHDNIQSIPWKYLFLPKGFTKPLDKYERPSPWIRGGLNAQRIFERQITMDQKLQLMYLKPNYLPYVKELCFEGTEIGNEPEFAKYRVDWTAMRDRILRDKLEDFVELLGSDWGAITGAGVQQKGKDYWRTLQ